VEESKAQHEVLEGRIGLAAIKKGGIGEGVALVNALKTCVRVSL
jgi:hypothetical protein